MDIEKEMEREIKREKKSTPKKVTVSNIYKVTTSNGNLLNVRSQPMVGDNVIGSLKSGDLVKQIGKTTGDFTKIEFNGKPAFVMTSKLIFDHEEQH